jgi:uncharacterized protein (DUF1810 family)
MVDPYDLQRFVRAQEHDYEEALSEIRSGRKRSHWMWYIFPQFDGLGVSPTSKQYAVKSVAEARAFLAHPLLGPRLRECAAAAARIEGLSAADIFGSRRHEAAILRHAVRLGVASRLRVSSPHRQVLCRRARR